MNHPKVFISYSHDSPEHSARVLNLAWALRDHGIDVELDQFHNEEIVDWPRWCNERTSRECSDFVVCVCTAEYRRRIEGKVLPEKGKGVYWKGALLDDDLYDEKGNSRLIPTLFDAELEQSIPRFLRGWTRCRMSKFALVDPGYVYLIRLLTGQARVEKNPLGAVPVLGTARAPASAPRTDFECDTGRISRHAPKHLIGREKYLADLDAALADPRRHVVTIVAWGGVGKTSLVAHWLGKLAERESPGIERVFGWSFYSQGTREKGGASAEEFVKAALEFFGDAAMAPGKDSAWDKGERIARLAGERRTLLVLDGLEPLQHPPGTMEGRLKDPAIEALLLARARARRTADRGAFCVVTTRESVADLQGFHEATAPEWRLENLTPEAGAAVLWEAGARRPGAAAIQADDQELKDASVAFEGHALRLTLLGLYLGKAQRGDIRKRTEETLTRADPHFVTNPNDPDAKYGHAFKVMAAYETWLGQGGEEGARQLAELRLLGLFDRPATPDCLTALCRPPAIDGLTEPLAGLGGEEWNLTVSALEAAGLVKTAPWERQRVKGFDEEKARKAMAAQEQDHAFLLGEPEDFTPPSDSIGNWQSAIPSTPTRFCAGISRNARTRRTARRTARGTGGFTSI